MVPRAFSKPAFREQRPAIVSEASRNAALLQAAGRLEGTSALIVAPRAVDLLCMMLANGCPSAASLQPGVKPDERAYSLVTIPDTACLPSADHVVRLACRVLGDSGRLVAGLSGPSSTAQVPGLISRLRLNGFRNVTAARYAGFTVLRAERANPRSDA